MVDPMVAHVLMYVCICVIRKGFLLTPQNLYNFWSWTQLHETFRDRFIRLVCLSVALGNAELINKVASYSTDRIICYIAIVYVTSPDHHGY
jgi:hypothetical protein